MKAKVLINACLVWLIALAMIIDGHHVGLDVLIGMLMVNELCDMYDMVEAEFK